METERKMWKEMKMEMKMCNEMKWGIKSGRQQLHGQEEVGRGQCSTGRW